MTTIRAKPAVDRHALYSAAYPDDLEAEARDFYRRFYRVEITDRQLDALLP